MSGTSEKQMRSNVEVIDVPEEQHGNAVRQFVTKVASIKRIFNYTTIFAFSFMYMSVWEGVVLNMYFALASGGPLIMCWGMLITWVGAMAQAASLAEMASIQPIAGAQYHWTWAFAPRMPRKFLTWLQGWITWAAFISLMCGICQLIASIILSLAELGNPGYKSKPWHLVLLMYLMFTYQAVLNIFAFKWVPIIEVFCSGLQIALFLVYICVFAVMGEKHSAEYVWTFFQSSTGWSNDFLSWNIGLLSCVWLYTGFDAVIHMSEETRQSRENVPKAMFWSIALNGLLAFAMAVAVMFVSGSLEDNLASSWPILTILQNVTGSVNATIALIALCGPMYINCGVASTSTVSRLTWAWARDGGLPPWFAQISPRYGVPVQAIILPTVLVMLLALLNLGSSAAFGAIIALSSLAMYFSYWVAIACFVWARYRKGAALKMGSWNMGRAGVWVNAYALLYTGWMMVFLPWPNYIPVTGTDMNYAGPIFLACVGFASATWFIWAKKNWPGPREEVIEYVLASEEK